MSAVAFAPFVSHTFAVVLAPSTGPGTLIDPVILRTGFSEVILPETVVQVRDGKPELEFTTLILRRAVTADGSLSAWVREPSPRDCAIVLLNGDRPSAVWQVASATPERLSYSALNAGESAVLIETLELRVRDFQRLDLGAQRTATLDETLQDLSQRMHHAPSAKT